MSRLVELADARDTLREAIQGGVRLWAAEPELFRMLIGLGQVDPSAAEIIDQRDAERRGFMAYLAARLDEQNYLRAGVDREQALAVLTLLTSFATFDSLYAVSSLPVAAIGETLLILAEVIVPPESAQASAA